MALPIKISFELSDTPTGTVVTLPEAWVVPAGATIPYDQYFLQVRGKIGSEDIRAFERRYDCDLETVSAKDDNLITLKFRGKWYR